MCYTGSAVTTSGEAALSKAKAFPAAKGPVGISYYEKSFQNTPGRFRPAEFSEEKEGIE